MTSIDQARAAANRCVESVTLLTAAALEEEPPDPFPFLRSVQGAVKDGWSIIGEYWPELADAYLAMVFDETFGVPEAGVPSPVAAWVLARRALDYASFVDRQQEIDLDAFGMTPTGFEVTTGTSPDPIIVATPGQRDQASTIWRCVVRFSVQNFWPLTPRELLDAIESAVPTESDVAFNFPAKPRDLLLANDRPPDDRTTAQLLSDLQTHIATLENEFNNRQTVLDGLLAQCEAWDGSDDKSRDVILRNLSAEMARALRTFEVRLPRPTKEATLYADRSQLVSRVRRYGWARLEFCNEVKHRKVMLRLEANTNVFNGLGSTTNEYFLPVQRVVDQLQSASANLIAYFESSRRSLGGPSQRNSGAPEWRQKDREFHINGKIKKFKRSAPNQTAVLEAFELDGWSEFTDLPIQHKTLKDTLAALNGWSIGYGIRFVGAGDAKQVGWKHVSVPCDG